MGDGVGGGPASACTPAYSEATRGSSSRRSHPARSTPCTIRNRSGTAVPSSTTGIRLPRSTAAFASERTQRDCTDTAEPEDDDRLCPGQLLLDHFVEALARNQVTIPPDVPAAPFEQLRELRRDLVVLAA